MVMDKQYLKEYYQQHKEKIKEQVKARQHLRRLNIDVDEERERIINDLNTGKKKFCRLETMAKYNINIDTQTLTYYHDKVNFFNKDIYEKFKQIKQTDEPTSET